MAIVTTDTKHYTAIAQTIRQHSPQIGMVTPEEMPRAIDSACSADYSLGLAEGIEIGKQEQYDTFWDAFQKNGSRVIYVEAFARGWDDASFAPKYDICPTEATKMFQSSGIVDIIGCLKKNNVSLDFSNTKITSYLFTSTKIEHLPEISLISAAYADYQCASPFGWMSALHTIDKIIVSERTSYMSWFTATNNLENVIFEGTIAKNGLNVSMCTKLTHDSLMSILNCLADYSEDASGTSWVVTLGATNLAKLTDGEKAVASQKGWTLA